MGTNPTEGIQILRASYSDDDRAVKRITKEEEEEATTVLVHVVDLNFSIIIHTCKFSS